MILEASSKKGYGGTSTIDTLSFYRRRPDVNTEIVEYDEWMTRTWNKKAVEEQFSFNVDFKDWQQTLSIQEHTILTHLMEGYTVKQIAECLHLTYITVMQIIKTILKKNSWNTFVWKNSHIIDRLSGWGFLPKK